MRRKIKGGILATIGYILSPLSWWNDLFINIPLAYAFGYIFGLFNRKLFLPMMILGYWLTNIIGLIMMHRGIRNIVANNEKKYRKKQLTKDLIISIAYTAAVIVLVKIGLLRFPIEYFH